MTLRNRAQSITVKCRWCGGKKTSPVCLACGNISPSYDRDRDGHACVLCFMAIEKDAFGLAWCRCWHTYHRSVIDVEEVERLRTDPHYHAPFYPTAPPAPPLPDTRRRKRETPVSPPPPVPLFNWTALALYSLFLMVFLPLTTAPPIILGASGAALAYTSYKAHRHHSEVVAWEENRE